MKGSIKLLNVICFFGNRVRPHPPNMAWGRTLIYSIKFFFKLNFLRNTFVL